MGGLIHHGTITRETKVHTGKPMGRPKVNGEDHAAVNRYPHLSVPPGMPIETYITNRLCRWALWHMWVEGVVGGGGAIGPRRICSWWGPLWSARAHRPDIFSHSVLRECPVSIEEAEETDRCYQVMIEGDKSRSVKYARVLVLCYLTNFTAREKAANMHPGGVIQSYYNRLGRAHEEMLGLLDDLAGGAIPMPGVPPQLVVAGPIMTRSLTPIGM